MDFTGYSPLGGQHYDWLLTTDANNVVHTPDELPTYKVYSRDGTELTAAAGTVAAVVDLAGGLFQATVPLLGGSGFDTAERYVLLYAWTESGLPRTKAHVFGVV